MKFASLGFITPTSSVINRTYCTCLWLYKISRWGHTFAIGSIVEVVFQRCEGKMDGPLRTNSYSQTSWGSRTTLSCFNSVRKYYCNCDLEAVMVKTDDNYKHHYVLFAPRKVNVDWSELYLVIVLEKLCFPNRSSMTTCRTLMHVRTWM